MAINPMLSTLNQNKIIPIKNMMNAMRSAKNPQMMLQQMMVQNPQVKQVMDYVQKNGGDAKAAFYKLSEEKGVNPDDILNMLRY